MGIGRLLAELLALHALCAQEAIFEEWFPATNPAHAGAIYNMHSALLECPLESIVRQRALEALRGADARPALLPDPTALATLIAESTTDALKGEVDERVSDLVSLIERDTIAPDEIRLPVFSVAPAAGDWDKLTLLPEVPAVAPICRVPEVHRDFALLLERQAGVSSVQRRVREGLDAAGAAVDALRTDLQVVLRNTLSRSNPPDTIRSAIGGTLAQLDYAIRRCAEVQAPQVTAGQDFFERQGQAARDLQTPWCNGETSLLTKTARMPSVLSILLEMVSGSLAVAVSAAVLALAFSWETNATLELVISLALGAAAGYGILRWRMASWSRLREEWTRFERTLEADAHAIRVRVALGINERVSHLKAATASDLRQTLSAIRSRFELELAGFLTVVDDELTALRQATSRRHEAQKKGTNWVVVEPASGVLPEVFATRFHAAWASLLNQVVAVANTSEPVTLEQYEHLIRNQVSEAVAKIDAGALTASVQVHFEQVRKLGTDLQFMPVSSAGPSRGACLALGMAGAFVSTQVELNKDGWANAALLDRKQWPDVQGMTWLTTLDSPVAALLPPGVAVVITREEVPA